MKISHILKSIVMLMSFATVTYAAELVDASFEVPAIAPDNWELINEDQVPGWETTATSNNIEIWNGVNMGVPSYDGDQHAELNSDEVSALYQDVVTVPGSDLNWSIAHRGRDGTDVAEVQIGPPGSTVTVATMTTDNTAWIVYSGSYTVPAGQTVTRFQFEAVSTSGGNNTVGNFLDHLVVEGGGVIAYPNSYTTVVDVSVSGNIITDDPADYGDALTISSFTPPTHGTLTVIANGGDGSFTYTPDPGYEGTDTFTYTITDGYGGYSTETVTINVIQEVANDDTFSTDYQTALIDANVSTNDNLAPGTTVTGNTNPPNGTITDGINADGTFSYTPDSGFSGSDTFTYTLSNGMEANVTILVADAPIVLPANLVAEYRMDECGFDQSPGDVIDNSINGLNGTSLGNADTIDRSDNKLCQTATFDGNGDYIEVADNMHFDFSDDNTFTISFWVYVTNDEGGLVTKDKEWKITIKDRKIAFEIYHGGKAESNDQLSNNTWYQITAVYTESDPDDKGIKLYINGSLDKEENIGNNIGNDNEPLYIGRDEQTNAKSYYNGEIDEVKIFSNAFTSAEVSTMYSNENANRNWDEATDTRVCNACQCTAKPGSNLVSFPSDFRNMPAGTKDVDTMLGTDFTGSYGSGNDWQLARRDYDIVTNNRNYAYYTVLPEIGVDLEYGKAYWIVNRTVSDINYSCNLKTMDFNATVTDYPSCRSANGKCALIELEEPNGTNNNGPYIYTMTSFAVQKKIRWDSVRVLITDGGTTTSYTPDQAAALGETFNATIWRYDQDGTNYTSVTTGVPGLNKEIDPCSGYWIELDKNAAGKRVQLLIPEE